MNPEILFATTPSLQAAYEQTGPISGEPLLLLHGFPYDVREYAAMLAARQLAVRWNDGPELPPQKDFFEHLQKQPAKDTLSVDSGDVAKELAAAGNILRARYTYPYQMHGSVGASCAVADVKSDRATIWSATQSAYPTRSIASKILNLPLDSVRVIYVRGSGCNG